LTKLKRGKNLLAFSAGIDSSALFFILQKLNIRVDLALVNYKTRAESDFEEQYAKDLAKKYGVQVFVKEAPKIDRDFENRAREFRYKFFETLIDEHHYDNLLTAHHLGDRLEWFLMRLIRGAGAVELVGMEAIDSRITPNSNSYNLIRPLLNHTKDELLEFLQKNQYRYFIDHSNFDKNIERNYIRELFATPLLKSYKRGIAKSFEYLQRDRDYLKECFSLKMEIKDFAVFELKSMLCIDRAVDFYLKRKSTLISAKERETLQKIGFVMVGRDWIVQSRDNLVFIAPFVEATLPKKVKEFYRKAKIPPKVRPYLYKEGILEINL
jgi:tRNA(Ile)-lysidine synthase